MNVSQGSRETSEVFLPEKSLREWGIAALLFIVSVAYLWPFRNFSKLHTDEAIILQGAQRILSGEVLYRDFFSFFTPGSYYWLALRFKVFGDSFLVARAPLLLYGGVLSLLTYLLARRVCSRWISALTAYLLLVVTLPYNFAVLHNWDSIVIGYMALYCGVRLLESSHWAWALAMATLASLTFLFEQSKGAGLILGLGLGFFLIALHQRDRPFLNRSCSIAMLFGLAWPAVFVLAYFAWKGSLVQMFTDWLWPLGHYSGANRLQYGSLNIAFATWEELYGGSLAHRLVGIFLTSPFFILPVVPFLALGLVVFYTYVSRRDRRETPQMRYYVLVCCTILGLALSVVLAGRPDYDHILYIDPPLFLVLSWALGVRSVRSQLLTKVQPLLITYILITFTAFGMGFLIGGPRSGRYKLQTRRGVLRLPVVDQVVPYIQKHVRAGETIFVYPYQPFYYFLTRTFSPTRYDYLQLGMHTDKQMKQAMEDLVADQTKVVVYAPSFNNETLPRAWPATPLGVLASDPLPGFIFSRYRPCRPLDAHYWKFIYMVRRDLKCPEDSPPPVPGK
jgi:4-amino-4-deoxy-L-arabinose transferase-like glycosyltransferase